MNSSHPPSRLLARVPALPSPATTAAPFRLRPADAPSSHGDGTATPPTVSQPAFTINPAFLPDSAYPGNVALIVQGVTLYAHRDVLVFSSPFFETLLTGGWRETASETSTWPGDRASIRRDSIIAPQPDPPTTGPETPVEPVEALAELAIEGNEEPVQPIGTPPDLIVSPAPDDDAEGGFLARINDRLETATISSFAEALEDAQVEVDFVEPEDRPRFGPKTEARIRLVEEKVSVVQDLLAFMYPHLECNVSWANVGDLLALSQKLLMPLLKKRCIDFLMTSAAGKPIHAIKLAEDYNVPELYKEASRFLLDNFANWQVAELSILSPNTLLKIERRRTYFLERLLKLGLVDPARDYVCCVSCPNPQVCARLVHDKWSSAWNAAFRFGPPQPSIIYRSLRQLEPSLSSPALHLPHTSCQNNAKAWISDLFDRMFSLGVRPVNGAFGTSSNATRINTSTAGKYFLFVTLDAAAPPEAPRPA